MTYLGNDHSTNIRDQFKAVPDEFISGDHDDGYLQNTMSSTTAKQQIETLSKTVAVLLEIVDRQRASALDSGEDMALFGKELETAADDLTLNNVPGDGRWRSLHESLRPIGQGFSSLAILWSEHAQMYADDVVDQLKLLQVSQVDAEQPQYRLF